MDTEEKIKKIVKELYEWQFIFSDHYTYGSGSKPEHIREEILKKCAIDILKAINEY